MADLIFRYTDATGRAVYTNEPEAVPLAYQHTLVEVDMAPRPPASSTTAPAPLEFVGGVHLASAALGASVALVLALLVPRLRRARWLSRIIVVAGAVCLLGSLYFGWVLQTSLGTGGVLATPGDALDEARKTLGEASEAAQERERAIEKLERFEPR